MATGPLRKVLVTSVRIGRENLERLSALADVVEGWSLDSRAVREVLPEIEAAVVLGWPGYLTRANLARMRCLRLIQTVTVGVNQVPFQDLPRKVRVCSNAGAFSLEVGEHAWGLLLAASKKIVQTHNALKVGGRTIQSFGGEERGILVLRGKTIGVVGYGGIGRAVAKYARAFGMSVIALSRGRRSSFWVTFVYGKSGLERLLKRSDAVLISLPLTRSTKGLFGARELGMMKRDAVLVNVARGDIVDQRALYGRLSAIPSFRYATDVWWSKGGKETLETHGHLASLPNFIGTPHISGPTGLAGGEPQRQAVGNVVRYLRGLAPRHIVAAAFGLEISEPTATIPRLRTSASRPMNRKP